MTIETPLPLSRAELAAFLPDQRSIKAFEKIFGLIPDELNNLDNRLQFLENPPISIPTADGDVSADAPVILITVDGLTLNLPKCGEDIQGRVWYFILAIAGTVTIITQSGDTFPTPDNDAETTIILNRRGSAFNIRCTSDNTWGFA